MNCARRLKVSKKLYIHTMSAVRTNGSSSSIPAIMHRKNSVMSESPRFMYP